MAIGSHEYNLDEDYFYIHKTKKSELGFGLDHTTKLIENGFGIYSCENIAKEIGPLKSNFYRIAFCLKGSLKVEIGLETFQHSQNTMHFNIPQRLFRIYDKSVDVEAYYLMFTSEFIEDLLAYKEISRLYPFFDYLKNPFLELSEQEACIIKKLMVEISDEIRFDLAESNKKIKLLLNVILIEAKRSYNRQNITDQFDKSANSLLTEKYKKLVGQHFMSIRSVKKYADKLSVSVNHLHKTIKEKTGKSAGEFIDEMLIMEIKALLRYSELNISEIVYQLNFTDTSHLSKFFKKYVGMTPTSYRKNKQSS